MYFVVRPSPDPNRVPLVLGLGAWRERLVLSLVGGFALVLLFFAWVFRSASPHVALGAAGFGLGLFCAARVATWNSGPRELRLCRGPGRLEVVERDGSVVTLALAAVDHAEVWRDTYRQGARAWWSAGFKMADGGYWTLRTWDWNGEERATAFCQELRAALEACGDSAAHAPLGEPKRARLTAGNLEVLEGTPLWVTVPMLGVVGAFVLISSAFATQMTSAVQLGVFGFLTLFTLLLSYSSLPRWRAAKNPFEANLVAVFVDLAPGAAPVVRARHRDCPPAITDLSSALATAMNTRVITQSTLSVRDALWLARAMLAQVKAPSRARADSKNS